MGPGYAHAAPAGHLESAGLPDTRMRSIVSNHADLVELCVRENSTLSLSIELGEY